MQIQISFEILSSTIAAIAAYFAYKEFKKSIKLNEIDKFISYREKLKKDSTLSKIVKHIQLWQNNTDIKSQIPEDILLFDFYNFIGFYEEMYILIDKSHIDKQIAKEMFAFYAIQIADNCYYWDFFQENYHIDNDWKNFRNFIEMMR